MVALVAITAVSACGADAQQAAGGGAGQAPSGAGGGSPIGAGGGGSLASGGGSGGTSAVHGSGGTSAVHDSGVGAGGRSGADSGSPDHDAGGAQPTPLRYSSTECTSVEGTVLSDPGDGSLLGMGCPDGMRLLGTIDNSKDSAVGMPDEGALCCIEIPYIKCAPPSSDLGCFPMGGTDCGARAGMTCDDTQFCAYVPGALCGAADAESTCHKRPGTCTAITQPVCGCDGTTYANACEANVAGVGVNTLGACPQM